MKRKTKRVQTRQRNLLKGRLFELVITQLLQKAGFEVDRDKIDIPQLTKTKKKLHGRGSTFAPDVVGIYRFPIPFVYPILLIGECKYYSKNIILKR
ncbi:MAG: hypothetical protein H0Z19_09240 [Archaeoglobus sp.]|uniref:hypothetical protein n=1 Tax=Archaeoglobus sp. TaxID=1872626 RepID=UPI001D9F5FB5|nr:hypothetical protein [Archaeoglobus sp.]MBO8180641.1 hypothetical protein [Archaeoglobus sp.]